MLLAIDIGNTCIAVGVFKEIELVKKWQIQSERERTCDEYQVVLMNLFSLSGLDISEVKGVIVSSVVPPLDSVFQKLTQRMFKTRALEVSPGIKTGMPILYDNPHRPLMQCPVKENIWEAPLRLGLGSQQRPFIIKQRSFPE